MQKMYYVFLKEALLDKHIVTLPTQKANCGIINQIVGKKVLILEYEMVQENRYIVRDYMRDGKRNFFYWRNYRI